MAQWWEATPERDELRVEAELIDVTSVLGIPPGPVPQTAFPGRVTYWLGDREISPEEYQRLRSARGG